MVEINNSIIVIMMLSISTILAGCNQSLNSIAPIAPPRQLPSTPAEPIDSSNLPPLTTQQNSLDNRQIASTQDTQNKTAENLNTETNPTTSSHKITREGMAGSWQVPTDGLDCRIILAFTKWSGGYRAATRKCVSPQMQSVNAWDVKDQSVVLVDKSGNEVARLFSTPSGRYNGRTNSGAPVSLAR